MREVFLRFISSLLSNYRYVKPMTTPIYTTHGYAYCQHDCLIIMCTLLHCCTHRYSQYNYSIFTYTYIIYLYSSFLCPLMSKPSFRYQDISDLFNIESFLKQKQSSDRQFYKTFLDTQTFTSFIEQRSFAHSESSALAFFDDCTAKVSRKSGKRGTCTIRSP